MESVEKTKTPMKMARMKVLSVIVDFQVNDGGIGWKTWGLMAIQQSTDGISIRIRPTIELEKAGFFIPK